MSPRNVATGKKAWERYLEADVVDQRIVRAEVASSWKRCRSLQVDPRWAAEGDEDQSHLLKDRLIEKQHLVRVARPFLRDLSQFVSGSQFQVILADGDGLLLEALGEARILVRTKTVNLCPGMSWSEQAKGTNAIGTALVERRPVQICGWEHFCEGNQFLTCSAAPILDPNGVLLGVLDVSGELRHFSPHTMGMVVAAARAIEAQLQVEQASHRLHAMARYSEALTHGTSDALIAVDREGIITEVNARGAEILGVVAARARGSRLREVCGDRAPLLRALTPGEEPAAEDVVVDGQGRRFRGATAALRDERGAFAGAVALFRDVAERRHEQRRAAPVRPGRYHLDDIVGSSPAIAAARESARQAASSASTVLILGESGSGKELFVNAIHDASDRSGGPLVAINCASLPESLIESELFGYAEGSFTGARKGGQAGKFELAGGGTLFLDEIGDMSLSVQAKLLRVLQERTVSRIGSAAEIPVDIRVMAATHRDLRAEAERGRFREDLYYRLAVLEIVVPPLRDRLEDLPLLAERIAAKLTSRMDRPPVRIEEAFARKLCSYGWPGNVRELENVIERAINRAGSGGALTVELLELPSDRRPRTPPPITPPREAASQIRPLRELEREAIAGALSSCGGNVLRAAAKLGIGRNTLYRKIDRYHLAPRPGDRPT